MNDDMLYTASDIRDFVKTHRRAAVMFGRAHDPRSQIMEGALDGLRRHFPLVHFAFVDDVDLAIDNGVRDFPTLALYENSFLIATVVGIGYVTKLRDMLNLWFLKY